LAAIFRFGPFSLDREAYRLVKGDTAVALPPKVLDLLFLLVSRPSALVTKDDILQALWPDVAVTDNAITQVVSDLRQALGDSSSEPTYVQTVPRRRRSRQCSPPQPNRPRRGRRRPTTPAPTARAPSPSWTSRT
jgi:DNA-binding response OmpR family regulator